MTLKREVIIPGQEPQSDPPLWLLFVLGTISYYVAQVLIHQGV